MKARFEKISIDDYQNSNSGYTAILKLWNIDSTIVKELLQMEPQALGNLIEQLVVLYKMGGFK